MKKLLIICLLAISSQVYAGTISGRQYDAFCTRDEFVSIDIMYYKWTQRWYASGIGVTDRPKSASTMMHMMFGVGKGFRLEQWEIDFLRILDARIVRRAELALQAIRSNRR